MEGRNCLKWPARLSGVQPCIAGIGLAQPLAFHRSARAMNDVQISLSPGQGKGKMLVRRCSPAVLGDILLRAFRAATSVLSPEQRDAQLDCDVQYTLVLHVVQRQRDSVVTQLRDKP